jgi:hypothetical protein
VVVMGTVLVACQAAAAERSPRRYQLDFSSYFGGSDGEYLRGMDVDAQGNIYVAGTLSGDGPTTPGVYQRKGGRGWVAKFSPTGALIWSTHFGDGACTLFSVKVDSAGFVYVSGNNGPGLPVTAGCSNRPMAAPAIRPTRPDSSPS